MQSTQPTKIKKSVPYWRKKADDTLTPIIKILFPRCLLCGMPTQVGHHFFHKSKSTALRYILENIIPLCTSCHCALHHNESDYSGRILKIKGLDWFTKLEKIKNQTIVKADWCYFHAAYVRLSALLSEL